MKNLSWIRIHLFSAFWIIGLLTGNVNAQDTAKEVSSYKQFVNVENTHPDAVVLENPDRFSDPIFGLAYQDEVEVMAEEKGAYVKIRVMVRGKRKEGWVKKTILSDEREKPTQEKASEVEGVSSSVQASKGSLGMVPVDLEGFEQDSHHDPWQHIDPTSADAKLKNSPIPYHLVIPAGIIVAGGALILALANKDSDPDPEPPIDEPVIDDPLFTLLDDSYSVNCGQSLLIYPLQNDAGTGLVITAIIEGPQGVQLTNDTTIAIPSTLSGDVSFPIAVEDAIGQTGTNTVSVVVEEIEIVANDDVFNLEAGQMVGGNVVTNDLCLSCQVTNSAGTTGTLEMAASGEFEYTAPDGFSGEALFSITIENPCGTQDTSNLIFNVKKPLCSFDWQGKVFTEPSACGLETGAAFATEEFFGPYNFSWSNDVEGTDNTDLSADDYQLFVTDTTTGCVDTLQAIVNELPPDYALDFETLTGECGATDNVQLFSNASPDQPITIDLNGATNGTIEDVTDPAIWLHAFVTLNPGPLTITVWAEEAGPECAQSIDLVLEQAPTPELVVLDTAPELIVLEINNAIFPVEIFVNGELFMTTDEPMVFLDGLPPGIYEIFGVDVSGCASPIVVVDIEGGGIQKPEETMRWSPQKQGLNNWILGADQIMMQTVEGLNAYYPTGGQPAIPVLIEIIKENWVASGATASALYQGENENSSYLRRVNYFELAVGRKFKIFESNVSVKLGNAFWNPQSDPNNNVKGWFIDGTYNWKLQSTSGHIQLGFRAGVLSASPKIMVIPTVQYTLTK